MNNIIEINNLQYHDLFENLNLVINKKKFITISGPNSCGKTTLIRILNRDIITDNNIMILNKNINDYKIEEFSKIVQCVIPLEIIFLEETLKEELCYYKKNDDLNQLIKRIKLDKISTKSFKSLAEKEIILSQIVVAMANQPKILLLDNITNYFSLKEIKELFNTLKIYSSKYNMTIIYTTVNLEESLNTDYIYIINDKKIVLEGEVLDVLQKDNIINKIGLNLPFMVDLSVKLRDYDLIDNIELCTDRMVDLLWK